MALNASSSILATKANQQQQQRPPSRPPPTPQPTQSFTNRLRLSLIASVSKRRSSAKPSPPSEPPQPKPEHSKVKRLSLYAQHAPRMLRRRPMSQCCPTIKPVNQSDLPPWRRQSADIIVRVESNSTLSSCSSSTADGDDDDVSTRSSSVSSLQTPQDEHAILPLPSYSVEPRKWELRPRAKLTQKKEAEAISVWRATSAKLNSERFTTSQQDAAFSRHIIRELYNTEQSYNRLLVLIHTRYMLPMMTTTKHASLLFAHLNALLAVSDKILHGVRQGNVAKLFLEIEEDMVVFLKYAVHYQANIKAIRRVCATNAVFLKIEQDGLRRRDTNRMGFADYLIAPFQRIPRYCLLIKDLMKHTPQERSDNLDNVLKMLKGLAVAMDHVQQKIPS